jgi:hypothetical protein
MITELVLIVILSFFVLLSAILGARLVTLRNELEEFSLRAALLEQGVKKVLNNEIVPVENTEGFMKFISESREWAFDYIDDVQVAIQEFKDAAGPEIEYFREYGSAMDLPTDGLIQRITTAYDKLILMLPEEEK